MLLAFPRCSSVAQLISAGFVTAQSGLQSPSLHPQHRTRRHTHRRIQSRDHLHLGHLGSYHRLAAFSFGLQ
jgi:hypothetical protein